MAFQADKKSNDKDVVKREDKDSPERAKQMSRALAELKKMIERGANEQECAKFISQHTNEMDKLMSYLHSAKGNAFVTEVAKHISPRPNAGGGAGVSLNQSLDDGTVDQEDPDDGTVPDDDGTVDTKPAPRAKAGPAQPGVMARTSHVDDGTVPDDDGTVDTAPSRPSPQSTAGGAAHGTRKPR